MPETKQCPNCGETILAVAKKCKYCGTWIEPKKEFRCPVCCEVIPEDSIICPVCHERLKTDPTPAAEDEASSTSSKNVQNTIQEKPTETVSSSIKKQSFFKKYKWPLIVFGVVAVLGIAAYFIFQPKSDILQSLDDVMDEVMVDEDGTSVSPAGIWYDMTGYLISDNGKKYDIDMELTISSVGSDEEGFPTEGSYHYASQSENNRISLSGIQLSGRYGLSQILLYSDSGTERFVLALDPSKRVMDGYWFQYDDKESCLADRDNYKKRFEVYLKY